MQQADFHSTFSLGEGRGKGEGGSGSGGAGGEAGRRRDRGAVTPSPCQADRACGIYVISSLSDCRVMNIRG